MRSYAAGNWRILWKLRFPAALPYIFAALKIGATASVVGALIGELPSSIPNGLGAQIINFSQYYSTEPRGLWATNVVAAARLLGCVGAHPSSPVASVSTAPAGGPWPRASDSRTAVTSSK